MIKIKEFSTVEEQLKWLFENRNSLTDQRKAEGKKADDFAFISFVVDEKGERLKTEDVTIDATLLNIRCIINTTNLLDSHKDVHIPGIWKKSLSETKLFYLCQEHDLSFKGIISDTIKAYTKKMSWKELGFDLEGDTEALVFDATVEKDRNPFMFEQYKKGYVRNHSVRMRYIKEYFCINSDAYPDQLDNWNKYIKYVANRDEAEASNYFWAVTEAKIIEGSAVVRGSNWATPTISITENKSEAGDATSEFQEPLKDTQTEKKELFINSNIY